MVTSRYDLTRLTLAVLFIGGLILVSFLVMRPFLPAIVWAATLVLATWPLMLWVQRQVGQSRTLAVLIMTLTILIILIVPLWLAVSTIIANLDHIGDLARSIMSLRVPPPPAWLSRMPLIGPEAVKLWERLQSSGVEQLLPRLTPYAGAVTAWFGSAVGSVGGMFLQFLLTTAIAAVMYARGEVAAGTVLLFGRRLGGERGEMAVLLAGRAIRGVALGVVGTALAQSLIGGIGLLVVGAPFAPLLTALMFILCLIQIGPALVLIPEIVWMYYLGDSFSASILLVFAIFAMTIDQFVRPILIRKGADLPLLLIFAGVLGGLVAFGILGIFIGPTILAVAYTLLNAWMAESDNLDSHGSQELLQNDLKS